jgi:hypothetical protein
MPTARTFTTDPRSTQPAGKAPASHEPLLWRCKDLHAPDLFVHRHFVAAFTVAVFGTVTMSFPGLSMRTPLALLVARSAGRRAAVCSLRELLAPHPSNRSTVAGFSPPYPQQNSRAGNGLCGRSEPIYRLLCFR